MNTPSQSKIDPLAQHYTDPQTGNCYISGQHLSDGHWRRHDPLHVEIFVSRKSPFVSYVCLQTILGAGAEYTPDQVRALAATLIRIADDTEAQLSGEPATNSISVRNDRGYEVKP